MARYIYEYENYSDFSWQYKAINAMFGEVQFVKGKIRGKMNALCFFAIEEANLTDLTEYFKGNVK